MHGAAVKGSLQRGAAGGGHGAAASQHQNVVNIGGTLRHFEKGAEDAPGGASASAASSSQMKQQQSKPEEEDEPLLPVLQQSPFTEKLAFHKLASKTSFDQTSNKSSSTNGPHGGTHNRMQHTQPRKSAADVAAETASSSSAFSVMPPVPCTAAPMHGDHASGLRAAVVGQDVRSHPRPVEELLARQDKPEPLSSAAERSNVRSSEKVRSAEKAARPRNSNAKRGTAVQQGQGVCHEELHARLQGLAAAAESAMLEDLERLESGARKHSAHQETAAAACTAPEAPAATDASKTVYSVSSSVVFAPGPVMSSAHQSSSQKEGNSTVSAAPEAAAATDTAKTVFSVSSSVVFAPEGDLPITRKWPDEALQQETRQPQPAAAVVPSATAEKRQTAAGETPHSHHHRMLTSCQPETPAKSLKLPCMQGMHGAGRAAAPTGAPLSQHGPQLHPQRQLLPLSLQHRKGHM
jgi:hypothetical protein